MPVPVGGYGPQVNKFKQVSSDGHQMSLEGWSQGWGSHVWCLGVGSSSEQVWTGLQWWPPDVTSKGPGHPVSNVWGTLYSEIQWVLVTCRHPSPCGQTDTHLRKQLPQLGWRTVIKLLFTKLIWCRFKSNNKLSRSHFTTRWSNAWKSKSSTFF